MVGNNGISKNNKMILLSKYDYQPIFSLLNFSIERSDIPIRFKSSICTLSAIPALLKQKALTLVLSVSSLPLCLLSSSTSAVHSTQHSSISARHVLRSAPGFPRHSQKQSRRSGASPPPPCFGAVRSPAAVPALQITSEQRENPPCRATRPRSIDPAPPALWLG